MFDMELPSEVEPTPAQAAQMRARDLVKEKSETMQAQMIQEMGAKSPDGMVIGTSAEPDALAWHGASTPTEFGQAGITSLKLRDPANRAPPWVQSWLETHDGAEFADVQGIDQLVDTPNGRVARVLEPVPMLQPCVRCHGTRDQIPADVRTELERRYPDDESVGYKVGDLRGAVWSEVAVSDG